MYSGYVALLDVLGFSALVATDTAAGDSVQRYLDCLQNATEGTEVDFVVFSDSIILTIPDETPEGLVKIAVASSRLMHDLVREKIPVRGAIARGPFQRARVGENVFVAGRAVIDAYDFERRQDWIGVMLAPSAVAGVTDLAARSVITEDFGRMSDRLGWVAHVQPCHVIPFHSDHPLDRLYFDGFAIVPCSGHDGPSVVRDSLAAVVEKLEWLRLSSAPNPAAQRKYRSAIEWLQQLQGIWQSVAYRAEQTAISRNETEPTP